MAVPVGVPAGDPGIVVATNVDLKVTHDGPLGMWERGIQRTDGHHAIDVLFGDFEDGERVTDDTEEFVGVEVDVVRRDVPRPGGDRVAVIPFRRCERKVVIFDRRPQIVFRRFDPEIVAYVDDTRIRISLNPDGVVAGLDY